jgi:hypothetical protein
VITRPNRVPNGHKLPKLFAAVSQANYRKKKQNIRLKIKNYKLKSSNYRTQYQASMKSLLFTTTSKEISSRVRKCLVSQKLPDPISKRISNKIKKEFVNLLRVTKLNSNKWQMKSCNLSNKIMKFKFNVHKGFKKSKISLTVKFLKVDKEKKNS